MTVSINGPFEMPLISKNEHFTKTGSGQTNIGKHSKEETVFPQAPIVLLNIRGVDFVRAKPEQLLHPAWLELCYLQTDSAAACFAGVFAALSCLSADAVCPLMLHALLFACRSESRLF
eukprot:COSAG06_NODE_8297_length_2210_cov_1.982946_3_plen_118_part_00